MSWRRPPHDGPADDPHVVLDPEGHGWSRVTVGLPVHNGERHLRSSIESILAQTYDDFELIVSDNASTDRSGEICREFVARDSRVRYHRHPRNLGAAENYNWLARQARGEFFKWASDDDLLAPTFLEKMIAALEERPDACLAYPRTRIIDDDGTWLQDIHQRVLRDDPRPSRRLASVLFESEGSPCFGVIRTDVLRRTTLIGAYPSSDFTILAEIALAGRLAEVDEPLFARRWPGGDEGRRTATSDVRDIADWFQPGLGRRFPLHYTKLLTGFVRAIHRAPIPPAERARSLLQVAHWLRHGRRWRFVIGECRLYVLDRLAESGWIGAPQRAWRNLFRSE